MLLDQLELYLAQIKVTELAMIEALGALPEAPCLLSIPGVAAPTAAMFLGSIGDPRAYHSNREVLKLAGLSMVERSSGVTQGRRRISKAGRPGLRKMAFLLALRSVTTGGLFRAEFEALLQRNGNRRLPAVVAVSRSVLAMMYSVARDRRTFTVEPPARSGQQAA